MNTVNSINYRNLNNADYYQFIENIVAIVEKEAVAKNIINTLKEDLPLLQNSFKKEQLTQETKQIVALDLKRDRAFLKLKMMIEAYEYDDQNPQNILASGRLQTIIKLYGAGEIIRFDYNKETASISNLVSDLRSKYQSDLDVLNLSQSLDYLETCNDEFKSFYASRNEASSLLANVVPFSRLRLEVNKHYKALVSDIESLQRFIPASAKSTGDLITRMNVEIDKFKLLVPTTPTPKPNA